MAIAVIWASPNKDGLTASAKNRVMEGIAKAGSEATELHLNQSNLQSCLACGDGWGTCRTKGQCIIQDDFAAIYAQLCASEGIVWVTPVYWHDLAERLKCLVDRLRRCEAAHNHFLQGKPNLLVACAGGTGLGAVDCLYKLEDSLSHMGMVSVDRLPVIRFNKDYMLPALAGAGKTFAAFVKGEFVI